MSHYASGRLAESAAAAYLEKIGFDVIAQNWRTAWCEIDIVARKAKTVFFCEVKYRLNDSQGQGLEYITKAKLAKMRFAAESWVHAHLWNGDVELRVIEVFGPGYKITEVTDIS